MNDLFSNRFLRLLERQGPNALDHVLNLKIICWHSNQLFYLCSHLVYRDWKLVLKYVIDYAEKKLFYQPAWTSRKTSTEIPVPVTCVNMPFGADTNEISICQSELPWTCIALSKMLFFPECLTPLQKRENALVLEIVFLWIYSSGIMLIHYIFFMYIVTRGLKN